MKDKQGVTSIISFPLLQDEKAVSLAIANLLSEGWKFLEITNKEIKITRQWIWSPQQGEEEVK